MTEKLWSVKLIWRFRRIGGIGGRGRYYTVTYIAMAETGYLAMEQAASGLSKDGDVDLLCGRADIVWQRHGLGESIRRCRKNRWDGYSENSFTRMHLSEREDPEGRLRRRWLVI